MSHPRSLPILLTAALVAQSVIGGWGHSHAHVAHGRDGHLVVAGHSHHRHSTGEHYHVHGSPEHPPLPNRPADKDDCSVCRHLALAAILTLDLEALAIGDAAEPVQEGEFSLNSTIAVGLHRPRSPPEWS